MDLNFLNTNTRLKYILIDCFGALFFVNLLIYASNIFIYILTSSDERNRPFGYVFVFIGIIVFLAFSYNIILDLFFLNKRFKNGSRDFNNVYLAPLLNSLIVLLLIKNFKLFSSSEINTNEIYLYLILISLIVTITSLTIFWIFVFYLFALNYRAQKEKTNFKIMLFQIDYFGIAFVPLLWLFYNTSFVGILILFLVLSIWLISMVIIIYRPNSMEYKILNSKNLEDPNEKIQIERFFKNKLSFLEIFFVIGIITVLIIVFLILFS